MPEYRLIADSFIGGSFFRAGQTITWDGPPGRAMVPLDHPPTSAKAARAAKVQAPVSEA